MAGAAQPANGPFYRAWVERVQHHFAHDDQHTLKLRERRKKQVRNLKQCCKRFFAFLFSHIGLSALIVGYTGIGGLMFRAIESDYEKTLMAGVEAKINRTKVDLYRLVSLPDDGSLRGKLDHFVDNYTQTVLQAVRDDGWRGTMEPSWSFSGSILYAVTVITTIGYGHVAPRTPAGKFVTMFYALIGIPLTFLYLSNIGDYLADVFRILYNRVLRPCFKKIRTWRFRRRLVKAYRHRPFGEHFRGHHNSQSAAVRQIPGAPPSKGKKTPLEDNSNLSIQRGIPQLPTKFYCYATLLPAFKGRGQVGQAEPILPALGSVQLASWTDIDRDLDTPGTMDDEFCDRILATRSNKLNTDYFHRKREEHSSPVTEFPVKCEASAISTEIETVCNSTPRHPPPPRPILRTPTASARSRMRRVSYISDGADEFCESWEPELSYGSLRVTSKSSKKKQKITVPISLSLSIMTIYIIFGSLLFNYWSESGQDYLKWSYFCFITLSTIGFGDIVPGTKIDSDNPQEKMIAVILYVAIGLSVFAMCFKLMQEEVIEKFKWLGRKIGAIRKK